VQERSTQPAGSKHQAPNGSTALSQQQTIAAKQQSHGCPGTHQTKLDCNAVTAVATVRQAEAADSFNRLAYVEIGVGLAMAFVTFFAAKFAKDAAKAARDTVKAFTEVEAANIVVTLEAFSTFNDGPYDPALGTTTGKKVLKFDVLAHNLGRSTAIIVHAGASWSDTETVDETLALIAPPRTYIVKPAEGVKLDLHAHTGSHDLGKLKFLWVLIIYDAPLRPQRFIRYCFEVWGLNSNVPYIERSREEWDPKEMGERRKWTPTGTIQSFVPGHEPRP
jgi:hypothetical protein